ncbi:ribonuclease HII [uncultured Sphaerochaeta sp.]|uniref:ribonuclease HII n=1 Tax=uncultured Sphaerochaeta sp. TaxID=886478 RepID=UPI0029CAAB69|nr:ribonuclease HII [uncultured Sphaerochaeta sp.]
MLFDLNVDKGVVCGLDEAGRGPLAGPVVAAAVVLPPDFPIEILGDSKQLSEKQRLEAEIIIKEQSLAWAVASVTAQEIDKINILQASLLAMKRAYEKVKTHISIDTALVDGNQKPKLDCMVQAIVKGDATIPEIMAASILAKNQRDRFMVLCDAKWPIYHFAKHKGYPTKEHREACLLYGLSPIHRKTFSIKQGGSRKQEEQQSLF